jgi:GTP-binding protein EngB required for normal cell division
MLSATSGAINVRLGEDGCLVTGVTCKSKEGKGVPLHGDRSNAERASVVTQRILDVDDGGLHVWEGVACKGEDTIELVLWDERVGAFVLSVESVEGSTGADNLRTGLALGLKRAWSGVVRLGRLLSEASSRLSVPLSPAVVFMGDVSGMDEQTIEQAPVLLDGDFTSIQSLRERLRQIAAMTHTGAVDADDPSDWQEFCDALDAVAKTVRVHPAELTDETISSTIRLTLEALEFRLGWPQPFSRLESAADGMKRWQHAVGSVRDELTFAVVGEFKSGKSTLINALLGEDICFVDDFEATMTLTSFIGGAGRTVTAVGFDGTKEQWTVEEYRGRCARREMSEVDRVDVVLETGPPYRLMDTPGLGSTSDAHAERADMAFREADALVFLADSSHLGSAHTNALLRRAVQIGLPLVVVVTKAEGLSDEDRRAISSQFSSWFGLPQEDVLFTGLLPDGQLDGLHRVREQIERLARLGDDLRWRANAARSKEIESEARRIAEHLAELAEADEAWLNAQREEMQHHGDVILNNICLQFERRLRDALNTELAIASKERKSASHALDGLSQSGRLDHIVRQLLTEVQEQVKDIHPQLLRRLDVRCRQVERQLQELQLDDFARPEDLQAMQDRLDEISQMRNALERAHPSSGLGRLNGFWVLLGGGVLTLMTMSILPLIVAGPLAWLADKQRLDVTEPEQKGWSNGIGEFAARVAGEVRTKYQPVLSQVVDELRDVVIADIARARFSGRSIEDFQHHLHALAVLRQKVTPPLQRGAQ